MTDLTKGIIEIEGMTLSRNTKASDFENINNPNIQVTISKRGHTYVKFKNPIVADGVPMFINVACYTDSDIPAISISPSIPDSVVDNGYGERQYFALSESKKWLEAMIKELPRTSSASCVFYNFDSVDYYASLSNDREYGIVGGNIVVTYHEV